MTIDTSIGLDDPRENSGKDGDEKQSGIDDETRARKAREDGETEAEPAKTDLTREDIERGNDGNTSAAQGNRSGATNKIHDSFIDLGKG